MREGQKRKPRGIGNQNARRHGWWSKKQPLSDHELEETVRQLLINEQWRKLRDLARAVRYVRGDALMARTIRRLARQGERRSVLRASGLYSKVRAALGERADDLVGDWEEL